MPILKILTERVKAILNKKDSPPPEENPKRQEPTIHKEQEETPTTNSIKDMLNNVLSRYIPGGDKDSAPSIDIRDLLEGKDGTQDRLVNDVDTIRDLCKRLINNDHFTDISPRTEIVINLVEVFCKALMRKYNSGESLSSNSIKTITSIKENLNSISTFISLSASGERSLTNINSSVDKLLVQINKDVTKAANELA